MFSKPTLFHLFLAALLAPSAFPQESWRSSLYPEDWVPPEDSASARFVGDAFLQDFSYAGYRRGEEALPFPDSPIFDVVSAYHADPTGESDSTAAIQLAIDAAAVAGGGVVFLPEGTYQLSVPVDQQSALTIRNSNIVLRGAGSDQTFLFNSSTQMRGKKVIFVGPQNSFNWSGEASDAILLREDRLGPTKHLALETVEGLAVGDWIVLHNPGTTAFIEDIAMAARADGVDWTENTGSVRGPRMLRRITAINAAERSVTIDAPTRWFLKTRDAARVYKPAPQLEEIAIEHLSLGNVSIDAPGWAEEDYRDESKAAYDTHSSYLLELRGVTNGWMRDVRSYNPGNALDVHFLSNGVVLNGCRGVTLYRVFMGYCQYGGGGGNGYGIRLNAANECLLVDCEVAFCRHGIVCWQMENSGNVVTRCYDRDSGRQAGDGVLTATSGRGSDHHGLLSHSNLFDNNRVARSYFEAAYRGDWGGLHGNTASQVVFWNTEGEEYLSGRDYIVHSQQFGIGYIIGTRGPATGTRLNELRPNSLDRTAPVDFLEGEGEGDGLEPRSLYLDQFRRRLGDLTRLIEIYPELASESVAVKWRSPPNLPWVLESSNDLSTWTSPAGHAADRGELPLGASSDAFFRMASRADLR